MSQAGYYREPTIHGTNIAFISDDDLWIIQGKGAVAQRLTAGAGIPSHPFFSPDGSLIAFTGREEGVPEVYIMLSKGGPTSRLTYWSDFSTKVIGWSPDGEYILFTSTVEQPFRSNSVFYRIHKDGGYPEKMKLGWGSSLSFGPGGGIVLGQHGRDPAQWKRYRGGRTGEIWIDRKGSGKFTRLLDLASNMTHPMWIKDRIYFMGDHEGYGNIYSCDLSGMNIRRHTDHDDYYVRTPKTDGENIIYFAGGDIYILCPATDKVERVSFEFPSPRKHRNRKMVDAARYLESYDLHPKAHSMTVISRGKPITFAHWEGPVLQYGIENGAVRYRLSRWLNDGKRIVVVSDDGGEEHLEIYSQESLSPKQVINTTDIGRPIAMSVCPVNDTVALSNHRHELILVDLESGKMTNLDRSHRHRISSFDWSPDGQWIVYACSISLKRTAIRLCHVASQQTHTITEPVLEDFHPVFDPKGRYIYFLSRRVFDPVSDNVAFDYGFPKGVQPMLITLRKDTQSPFIPQPHSPGEDENNDNHADGKKEDEKIVVNIDLDGIQDRILSFPLPEGKYTDIRGDANRVFILEKPVKGTLAQNWLASTPSAEGILHVYSYKLLSTEVYTKEISNFQLSRSSKTMVIQAGNRLRVIKAAEKFEDKDKAKPPGRVSGWIDLKRVKTFVNPAEEWQQMYRETWRLLRDHYFAQDLAGVNWEDTFEKYKSLVSRASTRSELSDILWELGGELGTSHCYEMGGDYPVSPTYRIGFLGADFAFNRDQGKFSITHIVRGDIWAAGQNSPLNQPGLNIQEGDFLLAVNGRKVDLKNPPQKHLAGQTAQEVILTIESGDGQVQDVRVKTIPGESAARLREKINSITRYVHERSGGRVGYLYMQDMGSHGFSQFHRAYLAEVERDALIVDVRNNAGGHVSSLLLEKLARKRLGYDIPRYGDPVPLPTDSTTGLMVGLCDEYSGSDGDIFAHNFMQLKLGVMIGRRTWGGVVGLNPTHPLVDGAVTTQPEFYNWYHDVGWNLENRGAVPDITVDFPPQDAAAGNDPQLERALVEVMKLLEKHPAGKPDLGPYPSRKPPKLPPRSG